jgi:hypothetical protein
VTVVGQCYCYRVLIARPRLAVVGWLRAAEIPVLVMDICRVKSTGVISYEAPPVTVPPSERDPLVVYRLQRPVPNTSSPTSTGVTPGSMRH